MALISGIVNRDDESINEMVFRWHCSDSPFFVLGAQPVVSLHNSMAAGHMSSWRTSDNVVKDGGNLNFFFSERSHASGIRGETQFNNWYGNWITSKQTTPLEVQYPPNLFVFGTGA